MIVILFLTFLLGCQKMEEVSHQIEEAPHQNFNKPPDTFGSYSLGFPPPDKISNTKLGEFYFEPLYPHICNGLVDSVAFKTTIFQEDHDKIRPSLIETIKNSSNPNHESRNWTSQEAIEYTTTTASNIAANFEFLGWDVKSTGNSSWHLKFWSAERLLYAGTTKIIHTKSGPLFGDEPPTWETTDYNIVLQIGIPSPCLEGY